MLKLELLAATVAGCGDVLRHRPISEVKIIPELFPRQLRAIKAMRYRAKQCPIPLCPMEAVFLLASCLLLPFKQIREIGDPFTTSFRLSFLMYACHMVYVVEDGTT